MPADAQVDVVAADFDRAWTEECRAHADAPSMIRVLWNLHGWVSVLGFFYWSCGTAAVIVTPIFMKNLIQYGVECLCHCGVDFILLIHLHGDVMPSR